MRQQAGEARIALDLWRAERGGAVGLAWRQERRLANVEVVRADEAPEQSARSGKFRQVIAAPRGACCCGNGSA